MNNIQGFGHKTIFMIIFKLLRKSGIAETGETRHEGQCIQI